MSRTNTLKIICLALVLFGASLLASGTGLAQAPEPAAVSDDQVNAIAKQLYCPVCENIPLDVCGTQEGRIARITLDRPGKLNAINDEMPRELRDAVARAGDDDGVHVIVLAGAGRAFCAGYDLELYAECPRPCRGSQDMPWDPMLDYRWMSENTACFMSLWRSPKPVICKVHGYAVAGGSDIALCADIVLMAEDARIGYPPARVWGCPTTAMWVYRVGAERAKRLLFTGDLITGTDAAHHWPLALR